MTVPAPPSTNNLFTTTRKGKRVPSEAYKAWRAEAGWKVRAQKVTKVPGRVFLMISVERESALADVDNRLKALLDLLVSQDVIDDDKNVTGLAVVWAPKRFNEARVLIMPAQPLDFHFRPEGDGAHGGLYLQEKEDA